MEQLVVVGNPVEHSLSPVLHNAALRAVELEDVFHYKKMRIEEERLPDLVADIRQGEIAGANITAPHKINIKQYMDDLTEEAALTGAVNTIYKKNGRIIGHNTDGLGLLRSLRENNVHPTNKKIVILGAGGAARAIVFTLALTDPKEIVIRNRTATRAEKLVREAQKKTGATCNAGGLETIETALKDADVLINCTSVGMKGNEGTLVTSEMMHPTLTVVDVVYNPLKTRLLKEAEMAGCTAITGIGMLVHQAAAGFEIWTGKKAPIEEMRKAVLEHLAGGP